jgi:DNA-binding IclR family transcriptional regulator
MTPSIGAQNPFRGTEPLGDAKPRSNVTVVTPTKELHIITETPAEPMTAPSSKPEPAAAEPPSILTKAFDLLRAFNSRDRVMTLSELARAAQLPKSTVHRLLARLVELDAVEHHGDGYKLSLGLLQLGASTPAASMRDLAMPYLAALHRWTGETVHFGVLRQFDVVYLEKLARPDSLSALSRVGARLPANCTAVGKALLAWEDLDDLAHFLPSPMPKLTPSSISDVGTLIAELREVREQRLAREQNEATPGLSCVAAPVVVQGLAVAALSIGFRTDNPPATQINTVLRDTAGQIARDVRNSLRHSQHANWYRQQI